MSNDEFAISVGQNISRLRKLRGMTQTELSEKLGLSPSYISCIEHGKKGLSMRSIIGISDALDASCDDILKGSSRVTLAETLNSILQSCPASLLPNLIDFDRLLIEQYTRVVEPHDKR